MDSQIPQQVSRYLKLHAHRRTIRQWVLVGLVVVGVLVGLAGGGSAVAIPAGGALLVLVAHVIDWDKSRSLERVTDWVDQRVCVRTTGSWRSRLAYTVIDHHEGTYRLTLGMRQLPDLNLDGSAVIGWAAESPAFLVIPYRSEVFRVRPGHGGARLAKHQDDDALPPV